MTITREVNCGWELGKLESECSSYWTSTYAWLYCDGSIKRTGSYAARMGGNNDSAAIYWNLSASRQKRVSCQVYMGIGYQGTQTPRFLQILSGALYELTSVRYNSNASAIYLYVADTLRATYVGVTPNIWRHYGIDVKIDSTSGWVKVYLDGIEVLSYTGNTGNADITYFMFGNRVHTGVAGTFDGTWGIDDLTIDDSAGESAASKVADRRYVYLPPNNSGNYSQFTPSTLSGYQCVDEIPMNSDTDYVYTAASGNYDSYALTDFTLPTNAAIQAVIPIAVAKKADTSDCKLALGTRLSSTDLVGSGQALSTAYGKAIFERQTTKPGGGSWSDSDVDSAEIVIKSDGAF